ncbi:hypothetical protein P7K49_024788, partial [Saguinus oedipus]
MRSGRAEKPESQNDLVLVLWANKAWWDRRLEGTRSWASAAWQKDLHSGPWARRCPAGGLAPQSLGQYYPEVDLHAATGFRYPCPEELTGIQLGVAQGG